MDKSCYLDIWCFINSRT